MIYFNEGDALRGHKIIAKARKVSKTRLIHASGAHKSTEIDLIDNAYCVIDRELESVRKPKEKA